MNTPLKDTVALGERQFTFAIMLLTAILTLTGMIIVGCVEVDPTLENQPPIATITELPQSQVGQIVELNGEKSLDPDGDPISCSWNCQMGDQTIPLTTPNSPIATFTPQVEGLYTVTLTVTDELAVAQSQADIQILPLPILQNPVFDFPDQTYFDTSLEFSLSCETLSAEIYYTTDGTTPSPDSSPLYTVPIILTETTTVKAISICENMRNSEIVQATYNKYETAERPIITSSENEFFQTNTAITITSDTPDAYIYYTTDNTTPTRESAQLYLGEFELTKTTTIKAITVKTNMLPSEVQTKTVTKLPTACDPKFSPTSGESFQHTLTITITSETPNASIYYTTNGEDPSSIAGQLYVSPIEVSQTTTIKAITCKSDTFDSKITSATFTKLPTVATPTFGPTAEPFFQNSRIVEIYCQTPDVTIRYTTNGRAPTQNYGEIYSEPITITDSTTVLALAYKYGLYQSELGRATFTKIYTAEQPVITPANGLTFTNSLTIQISCSTDNATIRYTTNGQDPTATTGQIYTEPIQITSTTTIKAIACRYATVDSEISSATYIKITNSGTEKWSLDTSAEIDSSPAIGLDETIYFGSFDKNVYAMNPDGSVKWTFETQGAVFSSPAIANDGTILIASKDNYLYALTNQGTQIWKFNAGKPILASPAIAEDQTIYVHVDGSLFAITPTGQLKWTHALPTTGSYNYCSPIIDKDGTIYVGSVNYNFYAINSDGSTKWTFPTNGHIQATAAIADDGTIYIGAGDGKLYAINKDGSKKWTFQTGWYVDSSAAIGSDGTIYVGSADNYFYAINPDGTQQWRYYIGGRIQGSPTISTDKSIYIGALNSVLYALNKDGTLKWSYATQDAIDSSPAIGDDGTLYIGSKDGYLYAINAAGRIENSAWPRFHRDNQQTGKQVLP